MTSQFVTFAWFPTSSRHWRLAVVVLLIQTCQKKEARARKAEKVVRARRERARRQRKCPPIVASLFSLCVCLSLCVSEEQSAAPEVVIKEFVVNYQKACEANGVEPLAELIGKFKEALQNEDGAVVPTKILVSHSLSLPLSLPSTHSLNVDWCACWPHWIQSAG